MQAWTWSSPSGVGADKFYTAQIAGSYFIVANNRQDFENAARALTVAETSKPPSVSVPGWETFSTHQYEKEFDNLFQIFNRLGFVVLL